MGKPKYSVVIPVRNEEKAVRRVLTDVKEAMNKTSEPYEIIVIDNASTDKSVGIIKELRDIRLIQNRIDIGYGGSIIKGVKSAESDIIITIDADGTYPAEEIPELLENIEHYAMITSARIGKKVKIPWIRKPGKIIHTMLISLLAGKYIPDMNSGLRAFKRDVFLEFVPFYPHGFSISTTFLLCCIANNYPIKFVPIDYHERIGSSKINIARDGLNFILLMLRAMTYFNPLRVFLPISILFLVTSILVGIYNVVMYPQAGIPDVAVLLFTSSIIIGLFGLMADMLSKILMNLNIQNRP